MSHCTRINESFYKRFPKGLYEKNKKKGKGSGRNTENLVPNLHVFNTAVLCLNYSSLGSYLCLCKSMYRGALAAPSLPQSLGQMGIVSPATLLLYFPGRIFTAHYRCWAHVSEIESGSSAEVGICFKEVTWGKALLCFHSPALRYYTKGRFEIACDTI